MTITFATVKEAKSAEKLHVAEGWLRLKRAWSYLGLQGEAASHPSSLRAWWWGEIRGVKQGSSLQAPSLQHPNSKSRLTQQVDWLGEASP